jgi:cellulose synthase/poly-beta-1,6-N-acetylglucosamine synthase-like glycosyltransferase
MTDELPAQGQLFQGRVVFQRSVSGNSETGHTKTALSSVFFYEGLKHGREVGALGKALDGCDRLATQLHREEVAGKHGFLIHQHGAGAAFAAVAGTLRAGEVEFLAQDVEQGGSVFYVQPARFAVDGEFDLGRGDFGCHGAILDRHPGCGRAVAHRKADQADHLCGDRLRLISYDSDDSSGLQAGQQPLGQLLLEKGLITRAQLVRALEIQLRTRDRLGSILMSLGFVKRRDLYGVLAQLWGHPFIDLLKSPPDPAVARQFAPEVLTELRFVPVALHTSGGGQPWLHVATSDKPADSIVEEARKVIGHDVEVLWSVTTDWDIDKAMAEIFQHELLTTATMGLYFRSPEESAYRTFRKWQVIAGVLFLAILALGVFAARDLTLIAISAVVNVAFLASISFKLVTTVAGAEGERVQAVTDEDVASLDERDLPTYTILLPVFREASVIDLLMENLRRLDYPASKLEILLLLEEEDEETLEAARAAQPPETVTFVIVPDGMPRTKPRACNFGLFFARGEFLVIYDAEDRPDPDQLKKVVIAFQRGDEKLICVQAALNYFNGSQNFLTRMFTLEYSYWFDYMLPGLDRLKLPIPLGGTSNHFRTDALRQVGGWDPFNVTEDADLGIRASAEGYRVGVVNSTTYEEATSRVGNWLRQRSRWIKGYMQTTLVYARNPFSLVKRVGLKNALGFAMLIGGTPLTFLCTLPMWFLFVGWLVLDLPLDAFYPKTLLVIGIINLFVGNALMIGVNMIGVMRRRYYGLLPFAFGNPLYWMLHSFASYKALWQLITKPFYWEKTNHGHHRVVSLPGEEKPEDDTPGKDAQDVDQDEISKAA